MCGIRSTNPFFFLCSFARADGDNYVVRWWRVAMSSVASATIGPNQVSSAPAACASANITRLGILLSDHLQQLNSLTFHLAQDTENE